MLIKNGAEDCKPLFKDLLPVIIQRLQASFNLPVLSNEDKDAKMGLQTLLCGVVSTLVAQLEKADIIGSADVIMEAILKVFSNNNSVCDEEALMVVGAMADKLESDFRRYIDAVRPVIVGGLQNFEAHQVCICAVNVTGDLCRAVNGEMQPHCDQLVQILLEILKTNTVNREVKPPVLSCFGDVALAIPVMSDTA